MKIGNFGEYTADCCGILSKQRVYGLSYMQSEFCLSGKVSCRLRVVRQLLAQFRLNFNIDD